MAEQDQDRTEQATPFKLQEARRRGQVPKSLDVNSFLILSVALFTFYIMGERFVVEFLDLIRPLLSRADRFDIDANTTVRLFKDAWDSMIRIFWPLVLAMAIMGVFANFFQTGPVFSSHPIKPDPQRLNPIQGFKRVFSLRMLYEAVKSIIKLILLGTVAYSAIVAALPKLMALTDVSPKMLIPVFLDHGYELAFKLLAVLFVVALLDLMHSRWDYDKKMRMSHRDIKDEIKRREGDPHVRSKIRQLQRERLKRSGSLRRVPNADVIVTNPTHLAVALLYDRDTMFAPTVIAKGAGELAFSMRKVAARHHIPVVENKRLARHLFKKVDIDRPIPQDLYPMVAKILIWVYAASDRRQRSR